MARTFISYAREDEAMAYKMYRDLKSDGHDPWIDKEDILPGERWEQAIRRAIKECSVFIALMSSKSVRKRGYVQKEVRHALQVLEEFPEDEIFLIPARLEECQPSHAAIEEINWVDLFPSYETGFSKILKALEVKCGVSVEARHGEPSMATAPLRDQVSAKAEVKNAPPEQLSENRERAKSDDAQTIQEAFFHGTSRALVISNIQPNKLRVGGREFRVKRNPFGRGCFVYDPRTRFHGVKRNLV